MLRLFRSRTIPSPPALRSAAPVRPEARPRGVAELVRRIEEDYQFRLGRLVIASLIQRTPVTVQADSDDPAARALADSLTALWRQTLPDALDAFGHGRASFEKRFGAYDEQLGIRPLKALDLLPYDRTEPVTTPAGGFGGVRLADGDGPVTLSPEHCWLFTLDASAEHPHGRSRYLGAPLAVWRQRRRNERHLDVWLDKFALGHGVARAPARYPAGGDPDANPMQDMADMLEALRAGGVAVLDSATDEDGRPLFDYDPPPSGQHAGPLENRRRQLDAAALRSLGIPERALTQDEATGSLAMAQVHWQVLATTCEGILAQVVVGYQRYVVDAAVALNFAPPRRPKLTVVAQPVHDDRRALMVGLAEKLLTGAASPLLDQVDVRRVLELAGVPVRVS